MSRKKKSSGKKADIECRINLVAAILNLITAILILAEQIAE